MGCGGGGLGALVSVELAHAQALSRGGESHGQTALSRLWGVPLTVCLQMGRPHPGAPPGLTGHPDSMGRCRTWCLEKIWGVR